jgi:hypothetical protein
VRHGIDHLLTFAANPEAAASVVGRLGFTLMPTSHMDKMGLVNRMILFADADPDAASAASTDMSLAPNTTVSAWICSMPPPDRSTDGSGRCRSLSF